MDSGGHLMAARCHRRQSLGIEAGGLTIQRRGVLGSGYQQPASPSHGRRCLKLSGFETSLPLTMLQRPVRVSAASSVSAPIPKGAAITGHEAPEAGRSCLRSGVCRPRASPSRPRSEILRSDPALDSIPAGLFPHRPDRSMSHRLHRKASQPQIAEPDAEPSALRINRPPPPRDPGSSC